MGKNSILFIRVCKVKSLATVDGPEESESVHDRGARKL